ncbi:hypothetical protein ACVWZK_008172 [Bradyrhizobium sp. GM0.4]
MRFIGYQFDIVVEFTVDDHVNFVDRPVTLAVASDLKPACVRDFGEYGKAVDYFVDMRLIFCGEEYDVSNHR